MKKVYIKNLVLITTSTMVFGLAQADIVPALYCDYQDTAYSKSQNGKGVILFGPTTYAKSKDTNEIRPIVSNAYWEVYNNLAPYMRPMITTAVYVVKQQTVIKVTGEVYRPHNNRPDQIIDTDWTLKREPTVDSCINKGGISDLINKSDKIINGTSAAKPEIWSLDRGGLHRKLYLSCTWRSIELPGLKVIPSSDGTFNINIDKKLSQAPANYIAADDTCPAGVLDDKGKFHQPDDDND